ncbi:MAG: hypothetical protein AABX05_02945 [Nanoarchaeota archaeon]
MGTEKIINSGDLELIVRSLSPDEILEHFGEDSFEYLAYQHSLADRMQERKLKVPRRSEDPAVNYGMLKDWIKDFHRANGIELPKGFHKRNKRQLLGMYHGMQKHYGIRYSDIVHQY